MHKRTRELARQGDLDAYRAKRDFERTPEPRGKSARKREASRVFVVQKHAARSMHHDFRLELDGVLLSWAVPKGPPIVRGRKALAVRVEDHPLDYGSFEGVIPQGEYGGGTVMLWDRGTWRSKGDARAALDAGKLDFELEGERLRGRWTLVRTAGRDGEDGKSWLLIKRSDEREDARAEPPELDRSVTTGRTMQEIAAGVASPRAKKKQKAPRMAKRTSRIDPASVPAARRRKQPLELAPQLATLADAAPEGEGWIHELKYDGYRLLAFKDGDAVRLVTRSGLDWTERFPTVAAALQALPVQRAIVDGEVVVLARDGTTDFQALQNSLELGGAGEHVYFAFDLPWCEGYDLRACALVERKKLLAAVLSENGGVVRYGEHVSGGGPEFLGHACELALEGAVSKRADSRYESRRTRTWLKVKCARRQEFVVGGWTAGSRSRAHFGALLLGVHDEDGALRYAGKVGSGFSQRSLAEVAAALRELEIDTPPFVDPPRGAEARGAHWTRPERVVEVAFTDWTAAGALRHPTFQGLRADKDPREVVREGARPVALPRVEAVPRSVAEPTIAGIELTHPDRVLYPEQGITKAALAAYYAAVADEILPHLRDRPLSLVRCPRGRAETCFYQKHVTAGMPEAVRAIRVSEQGGASKDYVAIDDLAGLVSLVQIGVLELHPWGARADLIERPDRVVIDLDPGPDVAWKTVVAAAAELRAIVAELGLEAFLRTTGGKGLHVVLPIERRSSWDEVKEFARDLSAALARRDEERFVLTATKARRQGRIFLDWLRNARGATAVASYSSRARPGATVATPLGWDELGPKLDPTRFTVLTVPRRIARRERDPWAGFFELRQSLTKKVRAAVQRV